MLRHIIRETSVSVRVAAEQLAVEHDLAVLVASLEEDLGPRGGSISLRCREVLAIDPDTSHSVASLSLTGRGASVKRALSLVWVTRVIEAGRLAIFTARAAVDLDRDDILPELQRRGKSTVLAGAAVAVVADGAPVAAERLGVD